MDINPIKTEVRKMNREDRLGADATCVLCGETALEALTPVSVALIEQHHPLGKNHEPDITVPTCRNCHAKLHEQAAQEGADLRKQPNLLDRILQMLRALAAFFRMLGDALSRWARKLEALIQQLDGRWPEWRELKQP